MGHDGGGENPAAGKGSVARFEAVMPGRDPSFGKWAVIRRGTGIT